jgi:hypothetical protein
MLKQAVSKIARRKSKMTGARCRQALALALGLSILPAAADSCRGVDRALSDAQRAAFVPAIERHLNRQLAPAVGQSIHLEAGDILQLFRVGRWHIVHVVSHVSDEPFLFYRSPPPASAAYDLVWAGAATMDEGPSTAAWVETGMPGIPSRLAKCFAWYVTAARDR